MADVQTDTGVMASGSALKSSVLNTADKVFLTNKSGGAAVTGDVLALDTATDAGFVYGVSTLPYSPAFVVPSDIDSAGLATNKSIANDGQGWVFKPGAYVPLATVEAAVSIGEYLQFGVSKKFIGTGFVADNSGVPPTLAKAIALNSSAGAGQIPVMLLPLRPWLCHTCRVYNSADENLTASVVLPVTFDSTGHDPLNMHNAAGSDSKVIIPSTLIGTAPFLVSGFARIFLAGGAVDAYIGIRVDGATVIAKTGVSTGTYRVISTVVNLAAAQYVELIAYTTSVGAVVQTTGLGIYSPSISVTQIGEAYLG